MLFLQGTRDEFVDMPLLKPVVKKLGKLATLHIIEGADHSFHVLKSPGRTDSDVLDEIAATVEDWMGKM
jgi:pimeloyl-ACP methyl ester carboxylesterase